MLDRRTALRYLAVGPLSLAASGAVAFTASPALGRGTRPLRKIKWPSPQYPTLQSAIDALPDGGVLQIATGTFPLTDPLRVVNKRLTIKGAGCTRDVGDRATILAGPRPTAVVGADRAIGLISYGAGGGGVLTDMDLSGFDACVATDDLGGAGGRGAARASTGLRIANLGISNTGRGILSLGSAPLQAGHLTISQCLWNGVSVFGSLFLSFKHAFIDNVENIGIYVSNSPGTGSCDLAVHDVNASFCKGGGIVVYKSAVCIQDCYLFLNKIMGIGIADSGATINTTTVLNTLADSSNNLGDGVVVWSETKQSVAAMKGNTINDSARAGVGTYGSLVVMKSNTLQCNAFDVDVENLNGFVGFADDLGGNKCDVNCNDILGACLAVSAGLGPPQQVGGLE